MTSLTENKGTVSQTPIELRDQRPISFQIYVDGQHSSALFCVEVWRTQFQSKFFLKLHFLSLGNRKYSFMGTVQQLAHEVVHLASKLYAELRNHSTILRVLSVSGDLELKSPGMDWDQFSVWLERALEQRANLIPKPAVVEYVEPTNQTKLYFHIHTHDTSPPRWHKFEVLFSNETVKVTHADATTATFDEKKSETLISLLCDDIEMSFLRPRTPEVSVDYMMVVNGLGRYHDQNYTERIDVTQVFEQLLPEILTAAYRKHRIFCE